ncbi:hypothetical protein AB1Y20_007861 [Prymnesium parvum]|uniref:Chromatin-remodeling ATPase INO80 n=1 Tax=Prymnesium parvum TaxID=97485 RepID=A0AB34IUQ0_PRYPA
MDLSGDEKSFSGGDTSDEEEEEAYASASDDDDTAQPSRGKAVAARLPKTSAYRVDAARSLEWLVARVDEAAAATAALAELAALPQPDALLCEMHPYQLEGMRWAIGLHRCGLSGILADEMGLGKTVQAISVLASLRASADAAGTPLGPFLVVAPLSTLSGWTEQLQRFCPSLRVLCYSGNASQRASVRQSLLNSPGGASVLLASYEPILADGGELKKVRWAYAVVDEAHRLKNRQSVLYRCLLDELDLGGVPRLLLTGTPVQNEPAELFNLLHFVMPQVYDDAAGWSKWIDESDAAAVRALSQPFLLRRLKADHLRLPPKAEVVVRVPLSPMQREWYYAVLQRNRAALGEANARSLVSVLASLRKCCNHPYLFAGAEPEPFEEGEHLVRNSAKLELLDKLLCKLRARGDRVLLFCQSTQMLDVLQDYMHLRRFSYERLDGSARAEERWASVASFQSSGGGDGPFVFLLSTRAGGLGLNLTAANTVIFYDNDWNPQVDAQATDRVHRLGQTSRVLVVRLICEGTVEEVIFRRAQEKLSIARDLVATTPATAGRTSSSDAPPPSLTSEAIRFGLADLLRADAPPSAGWTDEQLAAILEGEAPHAAAGEAAAPVAGGASMYVYGGVDYSARKAADDEAYASLVRRGAAASGEADEAGGRKRRRQLSPDALAAEQQAAAEEAARAKARRKLERWERAGYASLNAPLPADDEAAAGGGGEAAAALRFVVGDAMGGAAGGARLVLVWTDASGRWPSRGFFAAVGGVSAAPQAAYEAAHAHADLAMGDAHVVDCTAARAGLWVCLMPVLRREKKAAHGAPPALCAAALDVALRRVARAAEERGASVHSPRLAAAAGASWYTAERLLAKRLAKVETTVYYFPRRRNAR